MKFDCYRCTFIGDTPGNKTRNRIYKIKAFTILQQHTSVARKRLSVVLHVFRLQENYFGELSPGVEEDVLSKRDALLSATHYQGNYRYFVSPSFNMAPNVH